MLLSDARKILFVHIQKTGGETISSVLKRNTPDARALGTKHEFARSGKLKLGDRWNDYFKFAFVRNPWDRLVSWYSMITRAPKITWIQALANFRKRRHLYQTVNNPLWRYVYDNSSTFEEFVKRCTAEIPFGDGVAYSFAYNQFDYLVDDEGKLIVDFVGRFENFSDDLRQFAKQAGVKLRGIPRANISPHRHYSSYYTPELEEIVRERFARDIEYFGYEFERCDRKSGISGDPSQIAASCG